MWEVKDRLYESVDFNSFLGKVFLNLFLGFIVTGVSAYLAIYSGAIASLGKLGFIFLAILSFVLVIAVSALRQNPLLAGIVFYLFCAVEGILIGPVFLIYTKAVIFKAFIATGVSFLTMAILAFTKKINFKQFGSFLFAGLIAIIIASIINIFLGSSTLDLVISIITIVVFLGLIGYDLQTLEEVAYTDGNAYFGALSLYLAIINLFLAFLRIFGRSEE